MNPYCGKNLLAFNDLISHPCGMIDITLLLGEGVRERKVTPYFLVILCRSSFRGISGEIFLRKTIYGSILGPPEDNI